MYKRISYDWNGRPVSYVRTVKPANAAPKLAPCPILDTPPTIQDLQIFVDRFAELAGILEKSLIRKRCLKKGIF